MKEEQQNTLAVFLALALGVAIGRNWPKIAKNLQPFLKTLEKQYGNLSFATLGAMATQKEKFEDIMAGWQIKKKKKKGIGQAGVKRRLNNNATAGRNNKTTIKRRAKK